MPGCVPPSACATDVYFWRTRHGLEVDFVLYGPHGLVALEVKRSGTVNPADTRALREFKSDSPEASCFLLYGGDQPLFLGDLRVIPIRDALRDLDKLLLSASSRPTQ